MAESAMDTVSLGVMSVIPVTTSCVFPDNNWSISLASDLSAGLFKITSSKITTVSAAKMMACGFISASTLAFFSERKTGTSLRGILAGKDSSTSEATTEKAKPAWLKISRLRGELLAKMSGKLKLSVDCISQN